MCPSVRTVCIFIDLVNPNFMTRFVHSNIQPVSQVSSGKQSFVWYLYAFLPTPYRLTISKGGHSYS